MPHPSATDDAVPFDPSVYPRVYTASRGYRAFLCGLGLICAAGGLLGTWYFATGHEANGPRGQIILGFLSFLFVLLGLYVALSIYRGKVVLTAEAITVYELFTTKSMLRSHLQGWRILPTQYVRTLVLIPRDAAAKKIKLGLLFPVDDPFLAWLDCAPDLDAQDRQESLAQLDSNLEIGVTKEQRAEQITTARKIATIFNWVAGIATAWGWFYPRPYGLVIFILSIIPIAAAFIGLRSKGIYQFEGRRNDARPSLALPVILPGAALAIRSLHDFSLLHWTRILPMSFVVCFGLTGLIWSADASIRKRRWPILILALITAMYAGGLTSQVNALLDRSSPSLYSTKLLAKRVSRGRSTSWYLTIAPWGPQPNTSDVSVSPRLYESLQPGESVCIYLYPGALRIPWYVLHMCPDTRPTESNQ